MDGTTHSKLYSKYVTVTVNSGILPDSVHLILLAFKYAGMMESIQGFLVLQLKGKLYGERESKSN